MNDLVMVIGYGAVGRATLAALTARGTAVGVAQRHCPADLPAGVLFRPCDVLDRASLLDAIAGASQVVVCVGFAYDGRLWRDAWPRAMRNLVEACATVGARMVFLDNLYMYGPQDRPLREDMPLTDVGLKPSARAEVTRIWSAASARVRVAALRAPDFYGPGVMLSHLGSSAFGALAKGRSATLLAPPDIPHDFAYVPDIARAVLSLLDAPDADFGQAWHVPCAPTRTPREILHIGAEALGVPLKLRSVPLAMLPWLGLVARFFREVAEMRFTWDRPYRVDTSKFARRFWSDATPFEIGATVTARSFKA